MSPTEALLSRKQQESLGERDWQELGAREPPSLYENSPLGAAEISDSCKEDAVWVGVGVQVTHPSLVIRALLTDPGWR